MESRADAIRILTEQRREVLALLGGLTARARTRRGLGGGEWSAKDLLGHLESWERHAIDALAAWDRGEPAPIDAALRADGVHEVNRRAVAAQARRSYASIATSAADTHLALIDAIRGITDERWSAPASPRGRKPLGHRLGQILVGADLFAHDRAHLRDLRSFVEAHGHLPQGV